MGFPVVLSCSVGVSRCLTVWQSSGTCHLLVVLVNLSQDLTRLPKVKPSWQSCAPTPRCVPFPLHPSRALIVLACILLQDPFPRSPERSLRTCSILPSLADFPLCLSKNQKSHDTATQANNRAATAQRVSLTAGECETVKEASVSGLAGCGLSQRRGF